jgi:BirA family transcriptional regulator, biotin operon repressor / biotin---[acetyl-CoA-carboxylase] ligase
VTRPTPEPPPSDVALALDVAGARLGAFAEVRYFAEVDSTNDIAMTLAQDGAPHGTAVLAGQQRAGRGRRGRSWFSPPGSGIYLSVVVRPGADVAALSLVTLAAGVAAATGVRAASGLPVELKWPNDLVIGRPWRKLGGVLCEAVGGATVQAVVVGIGLNVLAASFPRELDGRATAVETELGREIDRGTLVAEVLAALDGICGLLGAGTSGRARICDQWRVLGRAGLGGAPVRWQDHGSPRAGLAVDIDPDGALVVDTETGRERVVAGEVLWQQLSRVSS